MDDLLKTTNLPEDARDSKKLRSSIDGIKIASGLRTMVSGHFILPWCYNMRTKTVDYVGDKNRGKDKNQMILGFLRGGEDDSVVIYIKQVVPFIPPKEDFYISYKKDFHYLINRASKKTVITRELGSLDPTYLVDEVMELTKECLLYYNVYC